MSAHIDAGGNAMMVDVSGKAPSKRTALAEGRIYVTEPVMQAVRQGKAAKGDVLSVAQLAGIMAAKRASDLIPLCHPIPLSSCNVLLELEENSIRAVCEVGTTHQTGVEMEALTGVSLALLTVYDMCKGIDKGLKISGIRLLRKTGGKSGDYRAS
jgi:cyclic pyranopterin phosphate synthase